MREAQDGGSQLLLLYSDWLALVRRFLEPEIGRDESFLNLARRLFALVLPDYWNNLTKYLEMRNLCKAMRRKQTHAQTNTT